MVKTPNVRHSKSRKDPLTIDLEASPVHSEPNPAETGPAGKIAPEDAAPSKAAEDASGKPAAGAAKDRTAAAASQNDAVGSDNLTASNESLLSGQAEEPLSAPSAEKKALESDKPEAAGSAKTTESSGFGRDAAGIRSSSTPPSDTRAPRRGGTSALAAGLIGSVVALMGAGALQYSGVLPSPGGPADTTAVERLEADMARLQSELAAVQSGSGTGASQAVGSLQSRIDQLAADLDTLRQAVESGGAGENAGLAALDSRIADLEARIAQVGETASAEAVDLGPVNERIAALEAQIRSGTQAAAEADSRTAGIEQTLAELNRTVSELSQKVEAQSNQPKIALSIAASALKAAIDRGQPFAAELETLAAISPDLPQLEPLRAHAEAGVSTREDLVAQMDEAANAMIAAGDPVDENAGYFDQLWDSAASLVTVRPVGAVQGEGVPETVARMEAALKEGDLARALTEYETLPESAKSAGGDFAARIRARRDVEALADQAIAEAMKTV